jgi:anaerobic magnesium-protoporphyrin IX monomethyl ester cyclase
MKILLIRPFSIVFRKPYFTAKPALNLGYLSAYLKKDGHAVRVLDLALNDDSVAVTEVLREFQPGVVGVSSYTPNIPDSFQLIKKIKIFNPSCVTVMGGPHSTSIPEETLTECLELDIVVIGEGEITFSELCKTLNEKRDPVTVLGLCLRQEGKIMRTGPRPLIENLDSLPFPDQGSITTSFGNLKFFDHNLHISLDKVKEVITTRGCTDFCTFCTVHRAYAEKGRSLRMRSAENVLKEISLAKLQYDIKHVAFLDDSFTISKQRTKNIMDGLKELRLSWNCDTRVNLLDEELIHEMVKTGCKKISIGVESGSEKILKLINKNITLEQIRRVFKWCHEAGLETIEANFLIGSHPDETAEDIVATRRLIRELKPQRLLVSVIVPFPGTIVRDQMLERGLILSNDWRLYLLMNDRPPPWRTTHFTSKELQHLQNTILAEFYFSPRTIMTTLKYIRSISLLNTYLFAGLNIAKEYLMSKNRFSKKTRREDAESSAGR